MKIPTTIYENLNLNERIDLSIAALARDDDANLTRLRRTCPRKDYSATDIEYTGKMNMSIRVLTYFVMLTQSYYAELEQHKTDLFWVETMREECLHFFNEGFTSGVLAMNSEIASLLSNEMKESSTMPSMGHEVIQKLRDKIQPALACLQTAKLAYVNSCYAVGINGDDMLKMAMRVLRHLTPGIEAYFNSPVDSDVKLQKEIETAFFDMWKKIEVQPTS